MAWNPFNKRSAQTPSRETYTIGGIQVILNTNDHRNLATVIFSWPSNPSGDDQKKSRFLQSLLCQKAREDKKNFSSKLSDESDGYYLRFSNEVGIRSGVSFLTVSDLQGLLQEMQRDIPDANALQSAMTREADVERGLVDETRAKYLAEITKQAIATRVKDITDVCAQSSILLSDEHIKLLAEGLVAKEQERIRARAGRHETR